MKKKLIQEFENSNECIRKAYLEIVEEMNGEIIIFDNKIKWNKKMLMKCLNLEDEHELENITVKHMNELSFKQFKNNINSICRITKGIAKIKKERKEDFEYCPRCLIVDSERFMNKENINCNLFDYLGVDIKLLMDLKETKTFIYIVK